MKQFVFRVRCSPDMEPWAAENFEADSVIVDREMPPSRAEVTLWANTDRIVCTIDASVEPPT